MVRQAPARGRWSRGLVFGLLTVGLGVTAHAVGGGAAPSAAVAVVLACAVVVLSTLLTRSYRSFPTLLAAVAAAQVVLHAGLSLTDHGMAVAMAPAPGAGTGHPSHLVEGMPATMHLSAPMLLAHAAATALAAAAMARGERLLAWLSACGRWFRLVVPPVLPVLARVVVVGPQPVPAGHDVVAWIAARGPPRQSPPVVVLPAV